MEGKRSRSVEPEERSPKRLKLTDDVEDKHVLIHDIPSDTLLLIFSFLDIESLRNVSKVSIEWRSISSDDEIWRHIYLQNLHLPELIEEIDQDLEDEDECLYTEQCRWKPSLVLNRMGLDEYMEGDLKEQVNLDKLMKNFGAPLCKGTVEAQFNLIKDDHYLSDFKRKAEEVLGLKDILVEKDHRTTFEEKCVHERNQYDIYVENQEARRRDNDSSIVVGNFSGCPVFPNDENFSEYMKEDWLMPICINSGIQRLSSRGGVKYFEPETIAVMKDLLKDFLGGVISEASKKLEGKEIVYTQANYTGFWDDSSDSTFEEEDQIDQELKINDLDIVEAIEKVHGYTLYGFPVSFSEGEVEEGDEYLDPSTNTVTSSVTEAIEGEMNFLDDELSTEVTPQENEEETMDNEEPLISDEDFIDDSDLDHIDPENLGHSLQDELIRASIRVHEQVYGKERAHQEKLYLRNWYGYGHSIFQHAAEPPSAMDDDPYEDDDFDYSGKNEQEIIDHDRKEDIAYYGYSLYDEEEDSDDDDEEEQEDENFGETSNDPTDPVVDGTEYHLRRLLRQESILCIHQFFSTQEEI